MWLQYLAPAFFFFKLLLFTFSLFYNLFIRFFLLFIINLFIYLPLIFL
jgi:hypothetical protein